MGQDLVEAQNTHAAAAGRVDSVCSKLTHGSLGARLRGQKAFLNLTVIDRALKHGAATGAAHAGPAAVGQVASGSETCGQNGLSIGHAETLATGLKGNLEGHDGLRIDADAIVALDPPTDIPGPPEAID